MDTRCYIGLPQWHHPAWHADRPDGLMALRRYARHFGTVEGNSSFYGTPKLDTLTRWLEQTPDDFRFCFKMPRSVSHDAPLTQGHTKLGDFFCQLEPMQSRTGLIWLQISDKLGPEQLPALRQLLQRLPQELNFGLEVRHKAFFAKGKAERELNQILIEHQINRVMFDTRLLFANTATDPETLEAQRKKPCVPLHVIATGKYPMVRFISPLDTRLADSALRQWADKVCEWIDEGRQPYLFFHTPNNDLSPQLGLQFAQLLQQRLPDFDVPAPWPNVAKQQDLF